MSGNNTSSRNESLSEDEGNQKNQPPSSYRILRPKRTVKAPARYRDARSAAGKSVDVHVFVDARKKKTGKSVIMTSADAGSRCDRDSNHFVSAGSRTSVREYPTDGLSFDAPMVTIFPDNQLFGGFIVPKCYASLYIKIWRRYGHIATTEV
ncbi:uncharacterized protein LOC113321980 [Papaver somniferum]|uniref:uncharacterized protein LOC113321980 n=1 Tax=Papaver somniferum TaxID=3469 RepID=UPI000E6F7E0D|nr:uncharacterized protein LOC113321980 [Papaver somniferum]